MQMIIAFIWVGFVSAISFMEAWIKFRAPNVTRAIGLGIGQVVFDALNKMEWCFAIAILIFLIAKRSKPSLFFLLPVGILLAQTLILLPILNERAQWIIMGQELSPSPIHFYYLGLEVMKVGSLFIFGNITFFQQSRDLKSQVPVS